MLDETGMLQKRVYDLLIGTKKRRLYLRLHNAFLRLVYVRGL